MQVSIGILAWNEERTIPATIRSLFNQSIFQQLEKKGLKVEVICVTNGCTDHTADAARDAFDRYKPRNISADRLHLVVREVVMPSKSNAWNVFVHEASCPDAELIFLMDADIEFLHAETFENMIDAFVEGADNVLAVNDEPIKHIQFKVHKNLSDRLSLSINRVNRMAPSSLTGQLYGLRGAFARRFRIPKGILVEDGFIKYMIVTRLYTQAVDNTLIRTAGKSAHVFEGYTGLSDVFNHQRRQAVSAVILNRTLIYLKEHCRPDYNAGQLLAERAAENPDWLIEMLRADFQTGGWWLIPRHILFARFLRCKNGSRTELLKNLAVALLVFGFDLLVFCSANRVLKTGRLAGVWKDAKNKEK